MPYFRFQPDIYGEYGITDYPDVPTGVSFVAGRVISEALPLPLEFSVSNPANVPPRHLLGGMIPVASAQLVESLHAAGVDNLQTFPAVLRNEEAGLTWTNFLAFNIIGLVDAADMSASEFDTILPGGDGDDELPALVGFRQLVLVESKVDGHLLFRLVHSPGEMFMADRVRSTLIDRKPPEGWGITTIEVPVR